ncbi:hypothetical protein, partial [Collinsella sp. An307]|uniref:hypothetical protein n=1 Tax=Collinsella sp. An307 TaxID=1965630 RepID=UPI001EF6A7B9
MAELSILRIELAPQEVHLQRVLPALVLPFRFIFAPQRGQDFAFIAQACLHDQLSRSVQHGLAGLMWQTGHTFCPGGQLGRGNFPRLFMPVELEEHGRYGHTFCPIS